MKNLFNGLVLSLAPTAVLAEVCETSRPNWDGLPASAFDEMVALMSTPPALILILASALVFRFRSQWGGLVTVVLWSIFTGFLTFFNPSETREIAISEGCIGSPVLFIAIVTAICVSMILYTAPRDMSGKTDGDA